MFGLEECALLLIAAGTYHGKVNIISWTLFALGMLSFIGFIGNISI